MTDGLNVATVPARVVCVGTEREVGALAAALSPHVSTVIRPAAQCLAQPDADAVHILFNEYRHDLRDCARALVQRGSATIYAIDGILEWRNSWEYPEGGSSVYAMRPVISHKVACIGRSQARVLASWGNADRCEIVGMPRLDGLTMRPVGTPRGEAPFRLLVATASNPGFDAEQLQDTVQSLRDLDTWARAHGQVRGRTLEWTWRLGGSLADAVRPCGRISSREHEGMAELLGQVDAVITTPSTIQLEAMLLRRPVALLDYHNRPQYVPAAWTISCVQHLDGVIPGLLDPPAPRMQYQALVLADALECGSPATPRMVALVNHMHRQVQRARSAGTPPLFPPALLPVREPAGARELGMEELFPHQAVFADRDLAHAQAAMQDCAAQLRQARARSAHLERELARLGWIGKVLTSFPGPRKLRRWYGAWRGNRQGRTT